MPRARKTSSGAKAQPVQAVTGQEYGRGVQQEVLQRAMPAPAMPSVQPSPPQPQPAQTQTQQSPDQTQGQPQQPQTPDFNAIRNSLQGMGGVLRRPDDRPDIPFTATLNDPTTNFNLGTFNPVNRTGEMMRELTRRTGDSTFADLAARAGL